MRPVRRIVTVVALSACLAAMVALVAFETVDADGTTRARSARFVWQTVPALLSRNAGSTLVPLVLVASLAVTVAGCFVIVWLAAAVESDDGDEEVSETTRSFDNLRRLLGRDRRLNSLPAGLCVAAAALLAGYAAWRMGLCAPLRAFGVADTFASFDHPFHIARAETLLRSILDGRSLRWVASHQGGYPAEFYPFGFAWVDVGLWLLAAGRLPMPIVHRIAVVLLFLAPGVVFYAMGRRDGWPAMVALTAFTLHVAVPGEMWSGGYRSWCWSAWWQMFRRPSPPSWRWSPPPMRSRMADGARSRLRPARRRPPSGAIHAVRSVSSSVSARRGW